MTELSDYPRPDARLHLNVFQPFGPIYEWERTPRARDYYEFTSYRRLVQKAEEGLFTAVFLGESLRLREHLGRLNDIAITGRPDALVLYSYLAAHTRHIGLVATLNTTYSQPVELARRIATVDVLSGGRAGWNVVTTDNGWTGENFRGGGFLDREFRYHRAEEYVEAVQALWDGWDADAPAGGNPGDGDPTRDGEAPWRRAAGWARPEGIRPVRRDGRFIRLDAQPQVPPSPQGQPVYFQAGDSDEGRDFAARWAEGIFTHHAELEAGKAFTADIRARARSYGRSGDDIKVIPGASIIVAATDAEAQELAEHRRRYALSERRIRQVVEAVWGTDLSELDLDGPLPEFEPVAGRQSRTHGIVHTGHEPTVKSQQWRALSAEHGYSVRQLVESFQQQRGYVGSAQRVADELAHAVRSDAFDGLNVTPDAFPDGLDDIVRLLVPALQERGIYPEAYPGTTLRETLGLPESVGRRVGRHTPSHRNAEPPARNTESSAVPVA